MATRLTIIHVLGLVLVAGILWLTVKYGGQMVTTSSKVGKGAGYTISALAVLLAVWIFFLTPFGKLTKGYIKDVWAEACPLIPIEDIPDPPGKDRATA